MFIIRKETYGGIDWHDSCTTVDYIKPNDNEYGYDSTKSANKAIINDLVAKYPYAEQEIRNAFATSKYTEFPAKVNQYDNNGNIIGMDYGTPETYDGQTINESTVRIWPKELKYNQDYVYGQVDYHTYYTIVEIKQPIYAVIENFLAIRKGIDSIERMYHKPFESYQDALQYMNNFKPHSDYRVQIYIACFDMNSVKQEWFDSQMQIIEKLEKNPDLLYDKSFSPFTLKHYENITQL